MYRAIPPDSISNQLTAAFKVFIFIVFCFIFYFLLAFLLKFFLRDFLLLLYYNLHKRFHSFLNYVLFFLSCVVQTENVSQIIRSLSNNHLSEEAWMRPSHLSHWFHSNADGYTCSTKTIMKFNLFHLLYYFLASNRINANQYYRN